MTRTTRGLIFFDSIILLAAVAVEFTPVGPIGLWLDGRPYALLAPGAYDAVYHMAYLIFFCVWPALHLVALATKERVLIRSVG